MNGAQFTTDFVKLLFQAVDFPGFGESDPIEEPGVPIPGLTFSLHTGQPVSDPDTGELSTSNLISYTGYYSVNIFRHPVRWSVSGDTATLIMDISFPKSTGGAGGTVTHFGVSVDDKTASYLRLIFWGAVYPNIIVVPGTTPGLEIGTNFKDL